MNVLITGGSRGIGAACVRAFCKKGDRVAFFYRTASSETVEALERETGAKGFLVDVRDADAVQSAVEQVTAYFDGKLHVLVITLRALRPRLRG